MTHGKKIFFVGLVAIATVPVVWLLTLGSTEELTADGLAAARARWAENGPKSYVVEIAVRDVRHRVEVRDGAPVSMTTDGRPAEERLWTTWTVEGMFHSLSEELSNLRRPEGTYGVSDAEEVTLRVAFDDRYGYPERFLRHVQGQMRSVEWRATLTPR